MPPRPDPAGRPLAGQVALVTGASRGIGAAVAVHLARLGAAVGITARTMEPDRQARLPGSLAETATRIRAEGVAAHAVAADLADAGDRTRIVPEIVAALGPVDVLVNNAAAAMYAPIAEMPLRRRRLLFELNVHAPVDLAQAVLPAMRARGGGSIVNVSSRAAEPEEGPPYALSVMGTSLVPYGASKAALERFTVGFAAEVYDDGIAVNTIAPVAAVHSEGADVHVGGRLAEDQFEPVELICTAIGHLAACRARDLTGRVLVTKPFLSELGLATGSTASG